MDIQTSKDIKPQKWLTHETYKCPLGLMIASLMIAECFVKHGMLDA